MIDNSECGDRRDNGHVRDNAVETLKRSARCANSILLKQDGFQSLRDL